MLPLISFLLTLAFLLLLLKTRLADFALDKPNVRSLHTRLTPRTGGLAVMFGVVITWLIARVDFAWLLLLVTLVGVSLVDDVRGLSVRWRFLMQLVVCSIFILLNINQIHFLLLLPLLLGLIWMTNLYNFMDGSDGLAAGMGVIGFGAYALAAYWVSDIVLATTCSCICASCLAFLIYNFYPAKIFMGDAGSIPLGFLAGSIGLYGCIKNLWPIWFPLLVFSAFIIDATVTLVKRLLAGEKIWQAHRSHYYQRLVQMGLGHRNTAFAEYALMFLTAGTGILILNINLIWQIVSLVIWGMVYFILMLIIDTKWNKRVR